MKQSEEWRHVKKYGAAKYEINQQGDIRTVSGHYPMDYYYDEYNMKHIYLMCRGKATSFLVNDLIRLTFKYINEGYDSSDRKLLRLPMKSKQFSNDENDYGGRGGGEWNEIREAAKKATENRKKDDTNIDFKVVI